MLIRSAAAAVNGLLVLSLYLAAFGVPSPVIGLLEVVLAQAAAVATWFALGSLASRPLALFGRSRAAIPA